jgi:hypothetical protein
MCWLALKIYRRTLANCRSDLFFSLKLNFAIMNAPNSSPDSPMRPPGLTGLATKLSPAAYPEPKEPASPVGRPALRDIPTQRPAGAMASDPICRCDAYGNVTPPGL